MGFFDSAGKNLMTGVGNAGIGLDKMYDATKEFIPGVGDAIAAKNQNAANRTAAQTQMNFQERMSNSAYQRSMDDMKKAGLNPMLAFSQGGASTPSGALPTVNSESKTKLGEFAMSSALGIKNASIAQQQANTQQDSAISAINLNNANSAKSVADAENTRTDTALKARELKGRRFTETIDKAAGGVVQKLIDSISNSAKNSKSQKNKEPLILGPGPKTDSMFFKKP